MQDMKSKHLSSAGKKFLKELGPSARRAVVGVLDASKGSDHNSRTVGRQMYNELELTKDEKKPRNEPSAFVILKNALNHEKNESSRKKR